MHAIENYLDELQATEVKRTSNLLKISEFKENTKK